MVVAMGFDKVPKFPQIKYRTAAGTWGMDKRTLSIPTKQTSAANVFKQFGKKTFKQPRPPPPYAYQAPGKVPTGGNVMRVVDKAGDLGGLPTQVQPPPDDTLRGPPGPPPNAVAPSLSASAAKPGPANDPLEKSIAETGSPPMVPAALPPPVVEVGAGIQPTAEMTDSSETIGHSDYDSANENFDFKPPPVQPPKMPPKLVSQRPGGLGIARQIADTKSDMAMKPFVDIEAITSAAKALGSGAASAAKTLGSGAGKVVSTGVDGAAKAVTIGGGMIGSAVGSGIGHVLNTVVSTTTGTVQGLANTLGDNGEAGQQLGAGISNIVKKSANFNAGLLQGIQQPETTQAVLQSARQGARVMGGTGAGALYALKEIGTGLVEGALDTREAYNSMPAIEAAPSMPAIEAAPSMPAIEAGPSTEAIEYEDPITKLMKENPEGFKLYTDLQHERFIRNVSNPEIPPELWYERPPRGFFYNPADYVPLHIETLKRTQPDYAFRGSYKVRRGHLLYYDHENGFIKDIQLSTKVFHELAAPPPALPAPPPALPAPQAPPNDGLPPRRSQRSTRGRRGASYVPDLDANKKY
jgi:hypothetical protein